MFEVDAQRLMYQKIYHLDKMLGVKNESDLKVAANILANQYKRLLSETDHMLESFLSGVAKGDLVVFPQYRNDCAGKLIDQSENDLSLSQFWTYEDIINNWYIYKN